MIESLINEKGMIKVSEAIRSGKRNIDLNIYLVRAEGAYSQF